MTLKMTRHFPFSKDSVLSVTSYTQKTEYSGSSSGLVDSYLKETTTFKGMDMLHNDAKLDDDLYDLDETADFRLTSQYSYYLHNKEEIDAISRYIGGAKSLPIPSKRNQLTETTLHEDISA